MNKIKVYGCLGYGSVIAEAFLTLADIAFDHEHIDYEQPGPALNHLFKLNPLGQVPTLILADGTIMTETLAIAAYVDSKRSGLLIPQKEDDLKKFWRWAVFLISSIYPSFTYGDIPQRWVADKTGSQQLRESTDEHRKKLWRVVESQAESPYFLGETFSAIDIYFAAMVHWRPRQAWFKENCPKITSIANKIFYDPRLQDLFERNFKNYAD